MGSGRGYSYYVLEPFVRSFVKYFQNTDLVLFVDDLSDFTRYQLEKVGQEMNTGNLILEKFPDKFKSGHPTNTRWKMFLEYIQKRGSDYSQILCVDTRDAFFQGDIFTDFDKYDEYVGTTYYGKDQLIGKCDIGNYPSIRRWIAEVFGKEEETFMVDKVIFCPSTIMGTSKSLADFLKILCENNPNYNAFGADECTLDYIIHHDLVKVENHIQIESVAGEIMHLNLLNSLKYIQIKDGLALNPAGGIPKVVHAYDTNLPLVNLTDKLYRSDKFEFNKNFADPKSMLDQLPHLVFSEKYEEALNIFMDCLFGKAIFATTFNTKDQGIFDNMNFLNLTEEEKKVLRNTSIKGYGDTLIRMWEIILTKDAPVTNASELLELSIQRALIDSYRKVMPLYRAEKIVACIKIANEKGHIVSVDFKKFVLDRLFERIKIFVEDFYVTRYLLCMNLVEILNLPLDEKWNRIKNEAMTRFQFHELMVFNEDTLKSSSKQWEKVRTFYRPYRIDADFENGGIK